MKKTYLTAFLMLSTLTGIAQVGVGTTTPQAALDVTATDKGMLVPRIALTDIQAAAPVTNPEGGTLVNGTLIYNTATAGAAPNNVLPGFYYWQDSTWVAVMSGATLDAAYDGTGSGAGRVITADAGTVEINGEGGFLVSGLSDSSMGLLLPGEARSHMFFNPGKGAFRAGYIDDSFTWSNLNVGQYSAAFGSNTIASGMYSTALGGNNVASGDYSVASGNGSTASGNNAIVSGTASTASGNHSTAAGYNTLASGSFATATGYTATASGDYSTSHGSGTIARSFSEFVIGQYNTDYLVYGTDYWFPQDRLFVIGKGTSNSNRSDALIVSKSGNLTVNGGASKPGGGSWTATSDSRLKKDVIQFKDGLAQVLAIMPVTYHYNELSGLDTSKEYVGVIAQDLQKVAPYMVGNFTQGGTEYLNVDSSAMTYMLINAVKEQQATIEQQKAEITQQNERLAQLEKAVLALSQGHSRTNNEVVKSE
jgi:hypothetical protein